MWGRGSPISDEQEWAEETRQQEFLLPPLPVLPGPGGVSQWQRWSVSGSLILTDSEASWALAIIPPTSSFYG